MRVCKKSVFLYVLTCMALVLVALAAVFGAHATSLHAAAAEEPLPAGHVKDTDISIPSWAENVTTGGYTIEKGQYVEIAAHVSDKGTGDSAYGIQCKIFPDSIVDNNYFYQFRCDFAIKRTIWGWDENNTGFTVSDGGWDRESYRETTEGDTVITVSLSEDGVLTYTFAYTADGYSHTRVFTDNSTMNSAVVMFGQDGCYAENASIIYPFPDAVKITLDLNYDGLSNDYHVEKNTTYTFDYDPYRSGYTFLGWQVNGEGDYYESGNTYTVGDADVTFVAAWVQNVTITIDKDGGSGSVSKPKAPYNQETGKFDIADVPAAYYLKKTNYAFKCWEVTVNGVVTDVDGAFSVDPGAAVVFKAIWGDKLTLTYSLGSCDGVSYGGATKTPGAVDRAEGGTVTLTVEPKAWAGYTFLGWSDGETTYEPGANYTMPNHNVTITAQWEALPRYSIEFLPGSCNGTDYGGQNLIDEKGPAYEGEVVPLARAIKWDGYTFMGWNDSTETYAANFRYTMPDHAVTFTAVWEKIPTHTVTYLKGAEDDVRNMPTAAEYYEGQIAMTLPVRSGYTFLGWSDGTNTYKAGEALSMQTDNLVLTAQWEALEEGNEAVAVLSGRWAYEDTDGTVYLQISGMEAAWDAYKAFGSYKVGAFEVTEITDTQIKFTIHADRPTGSGTNNIGCTYDIGTDTIYATAGYGTYTRVVVPVYTVSGTVNAGAKVVLYQGANKIAETTADADGKYSFAAVEGGVYSLEVSLEGYTTQKINVTVESDDVAKDVTLTATGTEKPEEKPEEKPDKPEKTGLSSGAIAGIVIACVVALAAGGVGVFFFLKKKKANK